MADKPKEFGPPPYLSICLCVVVGGSKIPSVDEFRGGQYGLAESSESPFKVLEKFGKHGYRRPMEVTG